MVDEWKEDHKPWNVTKPKIEVSIVWSPNREGDVLTVSFMSDGSTTMELRYSPVDKWRLKEGEPITGCTRPVMSMFGESDCEGESYTMEYGISMLPEDMLVMSLTGLRLRCLFEQVGIFVPEVVHMYSESMAALKTDYTERMEKLLVDQGRKDLAELILFDNEKLVRCVKGPKDHPRRQDEDEYGWKLRLRSETLASRGTDGRVMISCPASGPLDLPQGMVGLWREYLGVHDRFIAKFNDFRHGIKDMVLGHVVHCYDDTRLRVRGLEVMKFEFVRVVRNFVKRAVGAGFEVTDGMLKRADMVKDRQTRLDEGAATDRSESEKQEEVSE